MLCDSICISRWDLTQRLMVLLLLLLKKVSSARLGESDIHPISLKTPGPQYQPIEYRVMNCGRIVLNHGDLFRKVMLKMINFNWLFLIGWSEEKLKLTKAITENIAQCNITFSDLDYFLECYWWGCRPIEISKSKWFNPRKSMDCWKFAERRS